MILRAFPPGYPGGREAHLQQCGGQFAQPFAELCGCGAVSKSGGDAAGQDALHSAGVE